ncbi:MAG: hypothetical protein R8N23_08430 [Reichenbachiella sp.]|uniref:DUF6864 domain-containing function n=1 Tax=Reichenbachiella sp. TaxID=2184521 RepID=UPI002965D8F3|nr:hypothetical protein [Reichenbachiella sp.]MDW3209878.1 hypothetical protein [Reichenbachiella sp.]
MITASSKNGKHKRKLIFNENILLVDKYDEIQFEVKEKSLKLTLKFKFVDEGKKYAADIEQFDEGRILEFTLHGWYHDFNIENTNPVIWESTNKDQVLWIKYSTKSQKEHTFREFHITVWKEVKDAS